MKTKSLRLWCICLWLALSYSALANNLPYWLTPTNTATAPAGTPVTLRSLADAVPPPAYFWLSNTIPIPGATTNSYVVIAAAATTNVQWSIVASNTLGRSTNGPFYVRLSASVSNATGNVTLSGTNSVMDLLAIGNHLRGTALLTGAPLILADANQDGVVNATDQYLIKESILGRTNLGQVNSAVISDPDGDSLINKQEWLAGTFQTMADSDGDGVDDATELRDGTDPLDPRSLVYYGTYLSSPPVTLLLATPNMDDAGLFVATPPVTLLLATPNLDDTGLFVATPPVTLLLATPNLDDTGLFVATPPIKIQFGP